MKRFLLLQDVPLDADGLRKYGSELGKMLYEGQTAFWPDRGLHGKLKALACVHAKSKETTEPALRLIAEHYPWLNAVAVELSELRPVRRLPAASRDPFHGQPRIGYLAAELVTHTRARPDREMIHAFLDGFQSETVLSLRELSLFPDLLKDALLRCVLWAGQEARRAAADRQRAAGWPLSYRPKADERPESLAYFARRLRQSDRYTQLERDLSARGLMLDEVIKRVHAGSARREMLLLGAASTLRNWERLNWERILESLSVVESILSRDPVYAAMDKHSRSRYRLVVEETAQSLRRPECFIAQTALKLCEGNAQPLSHVGWYLISGGRGDLAKAVGCGGLGRRRQALRRMRPAAYRILILLSAMIGAGLSGPFLQRGALAPLTAVLCLFPAYAFFERIAWRLSRRHMPAVVPRLALNGGISGEFKSVVVIPALLSSPKAAEELLIKLKACSCANRDPGLSFALLGDLPDHSDKIREKDDEILKSGADTAALLNREDNRFLFLCRPRSFCKTQGRYLGWERKRGALYQFNELLLGEGGTEGWTISGDIPKDARYVITLDQDTALPPGGARELVGAMAHPLNRLRYIRGRRYGFGMLQPRVRTALGSEQKSAFGRLFGDNAGFESYSTAVSDFTQDVFGEGIFQGKGVYDLRVFHGSLKGRIPDGQVLSHDLLEGCFAHAGSLNSVCLYDGAPTRYLAYAARAHRWIRGDWQILPWCFKKSPSASGKISNPLSRECRMRIADNLRRSLQPVAGMLLILLSPISEYPLLSVAVALLPNLTDAAFAALVGRRQFLRALARTGVWLSAMPYEAFNAADAILRALLRQFITRKKLLEWTTASDMERRLKDRLWLHVAKMWPCLAAAAYFLALGMPLGAVFIAAPLLMWKMSLPPEKAELSEGQKDQLMRIAGDTWSFFSHWMNPLEHYLPPDNVQEDPARGVARRTSPTNIGLGLLSALSAYDLGFIDQAELFSRTEKTLNTMDEMERWKGHFYNWYDTSTLLVLQPRYISSVDSGNLAACLWTLSAACDTLKNEALRDRCANMARETDFAALYDERCDLFYIGYDQARDCFDDAHYDLLASESRILSLIALGEGKAPIRHFARLSRPVRNLSGLVALYSWSGTMFEYLMPLIFTKQSPDSLLGQSARAIVLAQRRKMKDIPWGISESGYFAFDLMMNYQYRAFGLSEIALRYDADEEVVAPYAAALALMVDAQAACQNLERLSFARGAYGYYEAVDYHRSRLPKGADYALVKSYMAHHQGMLLLAVDNCLNGGIMQKRFHSLPHLRGVELLLEEGATDDLRPVRRAPLPIQPPVRDGNHAFSRFEGGASLILRTQMMGNGRYRLMLTEQGCGRATWRGKAVNRYLPDAWPDMHGFFIYVRADGGRPFSPQPFMENARAQVCFSPGLAWFGATQDAIAVRLEVCVAAEDVEIRRVSLENRGEKTATIEVTAYTEPVLTLAGADLDHPAFSNLFVQTRLIAPSCLLADRKPRGSVGEMYGLFAVAGEAEAEYETSRERFIGRTRDAQDPQGLYAPLSSTVGQVLDPCFALRVKKTLKPGEKCCCLFSLGAAGDMEEINRMLELVTSVAWANHAFEQAEMYARTLNRYLDIDDALSLKLCMKAGFVLAPARLGGGEARRKNSLPLHALWKFGISAERPLLLVQIGAQWQLSIAREACAARELWHQGGIDTELVFLCTEPKRYYRPVYEALSKLAMDRQGDGRGAIRLIHADELAEEERNLLNAAARLVLPPWPGAHPPALNAPELRPRREKAPEPIRKLFDNGYGGFSESGDEYVIDVGLNGPTPAPWCNIIANENFGTLITERGAGYTWRRNSREKRLIPWRNDPVSDPALDTIYLLDEEGCVLSPFDGPRRVRHGIGYSVFETVQNDIALSARIFVPWMGEARITALRIKNNSGQARRLTVWAYCLPAFGNSRQGSEIANAKKLDNGAAMYCAGQVTLLHASKTASAHCFCNRAFIGRGTRGRPQHILRRSAQESVVDPALGIAVESELAPGAEEEIVFALSRGDSLEEARAMIPRDAAQAYQSAREQWRQLCGAVKIETPMQDIDILMNFFLPYQIRSSRLWGRTGFYQSGGAFGFRDQLQDCLGLLYTSPNQARAQIVLSAAHQFEQGDVQHWWHPPHSGVRTRISDDMLFLPFVLCQYLNVTADESILYEKAPYLLAPELEEGEEDRYFTPDISEYSEEIYLHALRAIRRVRFGAHGLPLIGGGDWNDAMNRVGIKGKGESAWLGWFYRVTLTDFAQVLEKIGCLNEAGECRGLSDRLLDALETHAWDGAWYRRAWFDNGQVMGSAENIEGRIDALSQAWAALAGADAARVERALNSAMDALFSEEGQLLRLLTPPFDRADPDPGYIRAYARGVRENGGQYTHAALWMMQALCRAGKREEAWKILRALSPVRHGDSREKIETYRIEPYVVAADIYSGAHEGRGGWNWYTGSAAWFYRIVLCDMLGIDLRGDRLYLKPFVPKDWREYTVAFAYLTSRYTVEILKGGPALFVDGEACGEDFVPLKDDGAHHRVRLLHNG